MISSGLRRSARAASAAVLVAAVSAACFGTVTPSEFEAEMQRRGGGLTTRLVQDSLAALRSRYGTDELHFTRLELDSSDGSLSARVRDPAHPDRLDDFTFLDGDLEGPEPVRVSVDDDLDARAFTAGDAPALTNVERLVDTALAKTAYPEGYVDGMGIEREAEELLIDVRVTSPRAEAVVTFGADGRFGEVTRQ